MSFVAPALRRCPRLTRLALRALVALVLAFVPAFVLGPRPAAAHPFVEPRIGGTPFEGPADAEATALWWNPAAIGPIEGLRINVLGSGRFARGGIERMPLCTDTGLPGACANVRRFGPVALSQDGFTGFGAGTWNFSENLTLGFGVFAPWLSCPRGTRCLARPTGTTEGVSPPTAFHLRSESFTTLYFTAAAAFRLGRRIHLGVTISAVDSFAEVELDRDTALDRGSAVTQAACDPSGARCGFEHPAAAVRVRVRGDGGTFWQTSISRGLPLPSGIGTNLGLLYRPSPRVWVGFAWQRVFPLDNGVYSSSSQRGAQVTPAALAGDPCDGVCRGSGAILYSIPDVWHLGARLFVREDIELVAWARVVTYGGYTRDQAPPLGLVLRLGGDPVTRGGAPREIVIDRGLIPQFTGEFGVRWWLRRDKDTHQVRLGAALAAGSPAVRPSFISAGALDATKLSPILGVRWQATRWLELQAAYSFTWLLPVTTSGAHDPGATVRCVDSRYDVDACAETLSGRGLSTNSGRYSFATQQATLGLTFRIR